MPTSLEANSPGCLLQYLFLEGDQIPMLPKRELTSAWSFYSPQKNHLFKLALPNWKRLVGPCPDD